MHGMQMAMLLCLLATESVDAGWFNYIGMAEDEEIVALRAELEGLKLSALQKRAAASGVETERVEVALDGRDPKAELIALLVDAHRTPSDIVESVESDLEPALIAVGIEGTAAVLETLNDSGFRVVADLQHLAKPENDELNEELASAGVARGDIDKIQLIIRGQIPTPDDDAQETHDSPTSAGNAVFSSPLLGGVAFSLVVGGVALHWFKNASERAAEKVAAKKREKRQRQKLRRQLEKEEAENPSQQVDGREQVEPEAKNWTRDWNEEAVETEDERIAREISEKKREKRQRQKLRRQMEKDQAERGVESSQECASVPLHESSPLQEHEEIDRQEEAVLTDEDDEYLFEDAEDGVRAEMAQKKREKRQRQKLRRQLELSAEQLGAVKEELAPPNHGQSISQNNDYLRVSETGTEDVSPYATDLLNQSDEGAEDPDHSFQDLDAQLIHAEKKRSKRLRQKERKLAEEAAREGAGT